MQSLKYPIILGLERDGGGDKGVTTTIHDDGARVFVCQLKKRVPIGDDFETSDIEGVIAELWFCRKDSLRAFIRALQITLDAWEEENDE